MRRSSRLDSLVKHVRVSIQELVELGPKLGGGEAHLVVALLHSRHARVSPRRASSFLVRLEGVKESLGGAAVDQLQGLHEVEEGVSGVPAFTIASQRAGDVLALPTRDAEQCHRAQLGVVEQAMLEGVRKKVDGHVALLAAVLALDLRLRLVLGADVVAERVDSLVFNCLFTNGANEDLGSVVIDRDDADLSRAVDDRLEHLVGVLELRRVRQKLELALRQELGQGVQLKAGEPRLQPGVPRSNIFGNVFQSCGTSAGSDRLNKLTSWFRLSDLVLFIRQNVSSYDDRIGSTVTFEGGLLDAQLHRQWLNDDRK